LAFAIDLSAQADAWQSNLQGGGTVRIDPQTRKPTLYYNGASTRLWDGVHELEDGSVIIVRDGVAVPSETMYHTWSEQAAAETEGKVHLCERLMRKVCGLQGECSDNHACELARQLQRLEQDELGNVAYGPLHSSSVECRKGWSDPGLFPACEQDSGGRCGRLVTQSCGDQDQCQTAPACDAARQLLKLEREERLGSKDPQAETIIGKQCRDALGTPFFAACH
jgi:hypothetical protein